MIEDVYVGIPGYAELIFQPRNKDGKILVSVETEESLVKLELTEEDELRLLKFFMKQ